MTLTTYDDLVQGTPEWLELRRGIVTASTVGQLITAKTIEVASNDKARALIYKLAAERITRRVEPTFQSDAMLRGHMDEPIARQAYADWAGVEVAEVGFMVRDERGVRVGASPDGLIGDDGGLEIKCPEPKKHLQTIHSDAIPSEYMAQVQCSLYVTGRAWWDFMSYCGGLRPFVKRIETIDAWQAAIGYAAVMAERSITAVIDAYNDRTAALPETEYIDHFLEVTI